MMPDMTHQEAIREIKYILTGPVGSRVIRGSVTKKPGKRLLEMHRKIHDALVLLHRHETPPGAPATHIVMERMELIFKA